MSWEESCLGYCLQTFLFLVIGGTYIAVQFVILPHWLGASALGVLCSLIWTSIVAMIVINFVRTSFGSPGHVPAGYAPDVERGVDESAEPRTSQPVRFCKRCGVHKPPRSHHCSTCQKCILKMDHHCPWVNNCVGHFNHKFFILFLFYVMVGGVFLAALLISRLVASRHLAISVAEGIMMALMAFLVTPLVIGVMFLFGWQLSLVLSNATTIESFEYESEQYIAKRERKTFRYPYDYGHWAANLDITFGSKRWQWLLPIRVDHDGIRWTSNRALLSTPAPTS